MTNNASADQTASRTPRLRVLNNGTPLAGAVSASVTSNNYYHADQFRLTFAASASATNWWDVDPPLLLDVQISLDGTAFQSLIIGEVDHEQFDITTGGLVLDGRDLSARLIEAKTQEAFLNRTSSEIATILAQRHNLTPVVTKTPTPVGRFYQQDHSRVTAGQFSRTTTEWELLTYLARLEQFDLFVTGTELHFQPQVTDDSDPFVLDWQKSGTMPRANFINARLQRSLTIAKDVQVEVRSWNSRHARGFTKIARAIGGKAANAAGVTSSGSTNTTQRYTQVRANLTEEQAQQLANQLAAEITRHERVVTATMPGELTLTPRTKVRLQGTHTSWDQVYFIDNIDRSLSVEEGFRQSVRLKNTSPRSEAQE